MVVGMSDCGQDREDIRVHLQMMQSVITRMADNSRACKTWAVTLVAAILVVVARFGTPNGDETALGEDLALIALVPTVLFWMIDMYYLALERGFRDSYENFVNQFHAGTLDKSKVFIIIPEGSIPKRFIESVGSFSIWPFYLILAIVIVGFMLLSRQGYL